MISLGATHLALEASFDKADIGNPIYSVALGALILLQGTLMWGLFVVG